MKYKIYKFFVFAIILSGCSKGMDPEINAGGIFSDMGGSNDNVNNKSLPLDYIKWIDDVSNGLKVEKTVEEFTYSFQFKPLEYVAIKDLHKAEIKETELKNKIEEYKDLQYYTLKISTESRTELLKKNLETSDEYYGRIQYFSFDMQNDIKLIEGDDTLNCVLFHFERVYGVAPYAVFNLAFPATEKSGNKTMFYDEKVFGAGRLFLTIQAKNIKNIPSVITK